MGKSLRTFKNQLRIQWTGNLLELIGNNLEMPPLMKELLIYLLPCHQLPDLHKNKLLHDIESFCKIHQHDIEVEKYVDSAANISFWHKRSWKSTTNQGFHNFRFFYPEDRRSILNFLFCERAGNSHLENIEANRDPELWCDCRNWLSKSRSYSFPLRTVSRNYGNEFLVYNMEVSRCRR